MDPRAEALALMAPNGSVVCSLHRLRLAPALEAPSTAMADMLLPCTRLRTPTRSATRLASHEDFVVGMTHQTPTIWSIGTLACTALQMLDLLCYSAAGRHRQ